LLLVSARTVGLASFEKGKPPFGALPSFISPFSILTEEERLLSIKETMKSELILAMKAKEQAKVDCIRFATAAIKKVEIDTRKDLDDAAVIGILMNLAKQRRDSIDQFRKGSREDLAVKEEAELKIIQSYLPTQMSAGELEAIVVEAIAATGAKGMKDMGGVMKAVMVKAAGKAEGGAISEMVKKKLATV
jgi:uncharacterized protein YqeY